MSEKIKQTTNMANFLMLNSDSPPSVLYSSDGQELLDPVDISAPEGAIMILLNNGTVLAKGDNYRGQLGFSDNMKHIPNLTQVNLPETIVHVSCGNNFTLLKTIHNQILGSGANSFNQFSLESYDLVKGEVGKYQSVTGFKKVVTGCHSCEWVESGTSFSLYMEAGRKKIFAVGNNMMGQLGLSNEEKKVYFQPQLVFDLGLTSSDPHEEIVKISAGHLHTLILTNRALYFSGNISYNQLDQKLYKNKGTNILNSHKIDLQIFRELTGGNYVRDVENKFNNNCVIMDNGAAVLFGGRYLDEQFKDMEVLVKPDGTSPGRLTCRLPIQSASHSSGFLAHSHVG